MNKIYQKSKFEKFPLVKNLKQFVLPTKRSEIVDILLYPLTNEWNKFVKYLRYLIQRAQGPPTMFIFHHMYDMCMPPSHFY